MASQELDILQNAFLWEQQQMDAWSSQIKKSFDADTEPSDMKQLLFDAWIRYFQSLRGSDQSVIKACSQPDETAAKRTIFNIMDASTDYDDVRANIREFLTY